MAKMCVLCFNSQWRSVVIGTVSCVLCLLILFATIAYKDQLQYHIVRRLQAENCISKDTREVNWSKTWSAKENECIFLVFSFMFPWPLWIFLGLYFILNANLVVSAVYSFLPGVTVYLFVDALFVGLLAASLCLSVFPSGLTRITLLTILFPLFSLGICAWMTVFGFYLRLEDRAKRRAKKLRSQRVKLTCQSHFFYKFYF